MTKLTTQSEWATQTFHRLSLRVRTRGRVFVARSGVPITIILGLWSIPLAAGLHYLTVLGLMLLILVLGFFLGTSIVIRALPPEEFAKLSISGRNASAIISVISFEIEALLHDVTDINRELRDLVAALNDVDNADSTAKQLIRYKQVLKHYNRPRSSPKALRPLRRLASSERYRIERIEAMKRIAAAELGIHPHRMCDHVLQFVPRVFLHVLRIYLRNLETMFREYADMSVGDVGRFANMVQRNKRLNDRALHCLRVQQRLLRNREQIGLVARLASLHSGMESVEVYARLLAELGDKQRHLINRAKWKGDTSHPHYQDCEAQILFAHRKQRAYAGMDLTSALLHMARVLLVRHDAADATTLEDICFVLERLQKSTGSTGSNREPILVDDRNDSTNPQEAKRRLNSLGKLPNIVSQAFVSSRRATISMFEGLAVGLLNNQNGRTVLVTHRYSRTVRDVLKRGLDADLCRRLRQRHVNTAPHPSMLERNLQRAEMPALFLLQQDEGERGDARAMEYELREDENTEAFSSLATGSDDVLVSLTRPSDRVIFLVGAECFDADMRVVIPIATMLLLRSLLPAMHDRHVDTYVVVVADAYKRVDPGEIDRMLLNEHVDRVTPEDPSSIDMIISGIDTANDLGPLLAPNGRIAKILGGRIA
jgi:hypothetical protein